jgi:hypothetical protein
MDHAPQAPRAGHVDAVVVARAEVDGGEVAVLELRRQPLVAAEQGGGAVGVALGLEDLVVLDAAELADAPSTGQTKVGVRDRPGTWPSARG